MNELNGNEYYHGLAGFLTTENKKDNVSLSLSQLESILVSGGLLSKNYRNNLGISSEGKPVFNGEDYISLCKKNFSNDELHGINEGLDSAYNKYIIDKLAIVISDDIESSLEFRNGDYDRLPGERQVKDKIGIEYFKAIRVGYEFEPLRNIVIEEVNSLLLKYNINIPIIDNSDKLVSDFSPKM